MPLTPKVKLRQKVERACMQVLIDEVTKAGFVVANVYDGGDYVEVTDAASVIEAVCAVDEATIHFAPAEAPAEWGHLGVFIVLGNDPGDECISDFHTGRPRFAQAVERACERIRTSLAVTVQ